MPSPFPGMNPYLERATAWESFHPGFIAAAQFHIAAQLRPEYTVRIENRVYIHEPVASFHISIMDAVDMERIGYLTIRDRDGNDLIAVVELLSPTNKYAGPDREQYLGKRRELLRSRAGVWPWRLRDSLPPIPIPLRAPDPDAHLDLKALIDQVYDGGRYGSYIYSGSPEPRLSPDHAAWAAAFLP